MINIKIYNILIPIWGESYIYRFMRYCLPSLLSKNNIYALDGDVRLVFLTEKTSINIIRNEIKLTI